MILSRWTVSFNLIQFDFIQFNSTQFHHTNWYQLVWWNWCRWLLAPTFTYSNLLGIQSWSLNLKIRHLIGKGNNSKIICKPKHSNQKRLGMTKMKQSYHTFLPCPWQTSLITAALSLWPVVTSRSFLVSHDQLIHIGMLTEPLIYPWNKLYKCSDELQIGEFHLGLCLKVFCLRK